MRVDGVAHKIFGQLDTADYQAIYEEASDTFQQGPGGASGFARQLDQNRHKLGRCQEPTKLGKLGTSLTPYGLVSVQHYSRVCANGITDIEVSAVGRRGQAKLIGLHFASPALEELDPLASRPEWVSDDDLALLKRLKIDPQADLETRADYHWRWRAPKILRAGDFVCPADSAVDVSRTIKVVSAPEGKFCRNVDGQEASSLKLDGSGSTTRLD